MTKGINTIVKNLKEGKAVMAGVMYDARKDTGNPNEATNHYITIVGMGTDKQGAYFLIMIIMLENDIKSKLEKVFVLILNKFRLSQAKDGTYYFSDGADGNIPYNQNKTVEMGNKNKQPTRYILTQVRDNK